MTDFFLKKNFLTYLLMEYKRTVEYFKQLYSTTNRHAARKQHAYLLLFSRIENYFTITFIVLPSDSFMIFRPDTGAVVSIPSIV